MTDDILSIFAIHGVASVFTQLETDYQKKLKLLRDSYTRIYSIFGENGILLEILNNMTIFYVHGFHISYQIDQGKYKFIVDLHLVEGKVQPHLVFTIKNTASKKIIQHTFLVYTDELTLSSQFMLLFRNAFATYYGRSLNEVPVQ